ncbi:MAG: transglycosylase SLT domain-containing protein [Desulfosoma sp.]|uniref:transglycosylase SLT domain-containing protein n=1 Tax=Desulfosoma sp. TaxID=2603217 RepID=UPI004049B04B
MRWHIVLTAMMSLVAFSCSGIGTKQAQEPTAIVSAPPVHSSIPSQPPTFMAPYVAPPSNMDLCGEPVPLHDRDVLERFDREFTIVVYSHAQVYLWLKRAERFFPWFEEELRRRGLPEDLKYVAVAESDLQHGAVSPAGAAGMWQFIPSTGSRYGLDQNPQLDQRYDFEMATDSALRYLADLYRRFNNWTLAIAAYNCGEKRVSDEMAFQRVSDYYQLKLPLETERYVFRILAIKAVLSNPQRYGYALPSGAGYPPERFDVVTITTRYAVPIVALAQRAGITYREFKRLNPAFTTTSIPPGTHRVRVPEGHGKALEQGLESFLASYRVPEVILHRVNRGETLTEIAKRYNVCVSDIKQWNGLKDSTVKPGQTLRIQR